MACAACSKKRLRIIRPISSQRSAGVYAPKKNIAVNMNQQISPSENSNGNSASSDNEGGK
jgi:hypothetical protein